MDMSSSSEHACKISMLWNWYTVDSCFIARSWHVKSKGAFAGSCIGVFLLVVVSQWLHRFAREYDAALIAKYSSAQPLSKATSEEDKSSLEDFSFTRAKNPEWDTLSHSWLFASPAFGLARALLLEHSLRTIMFTVEWGLSYIIMLLFMYYNGYIIISCILGALVGRFLFTFSEPLNGACLSDSQDLDRKCCR